VTVNGPPVINNSITDISFDEDTVDTGINLHHWFKDDDPGDTLSFGYAGNTNISVTICDNGTVKLKPAENWFGQESISFYANDSKFEISGEVMITVNPVNDRPINNNFTVTQPDDDKINVTFTAVEAEDVDDIELIYLWDFGDGEKGEGLEVEHTFKKREQETEYTVTLVISDGEDESEPCSKTVIIPALESSDGTDGKDGNDHNETDGIDGDDSENVNPNSLFIIVFILSIIIITVVLFFIMKKKKEERIEEKSDLQEDEKYSDTDESPLDIEKDSLDIEEESMESQTEIEQEPETDSSEGEQESSDGEIIDELLSENDEILDEENQEEEVSVESKDNKKMNK